MERTREPSIGRVRATPGAEPVIDDRGIIALSQAKWEVEMVRIWSELRAARLTEQATDLMTALWIAIWAYIAWQLYQLLAAFAVAGRTIRDGGDAMAQSGRDLGGALSGIPLVGEGLQDVAEDAFAGAGGPLSAFGSDLEAFILLIATVLSLLVLLVPLVPWLSRYLPWRWERLRRLRAAHRAVRAAPTVLAGKVDEVLALRAITRLEYRDLLDYTPDPIGDWVGGRHDRLARAELASVGLRPTRP